MKSNKLLLTLFVILGVFLLLSGCTDFNLPKTDHGITVPEEFSELIINFNSNNGTEVLSVSPKNGFISMPQNPTKEGFIFDGWYLDNDTFMNRFDIETFLKGEVVLDITLYAKWIVNQFKLVFKDSDGTILQQSIHQVGEDLSNLNIPMPTKIGYTFSGWSNVIPSNMPQSDLIIEAQYVINQYSINFETFGGSGVATIKQEYMSVVIQPQNPIKEGYTFGGWYEDNNYTKPASFITMPAKDSTFYAKWNINTYSVTFIDDNDLVIQETTHIFNSDLSSINVPVIEKIGHSFMGWNTELPKFMPAENITLKAKFEVNRYHIEFESNEGSYVENIEADYNTKINEPANPTKEGHTFVGWYEDIELTILYEFNTMQARHILLYAKWQINQYSITFESMGGTLTSEYKADFNTVIDKPNDPTKKGYEFDGWYLDLDYKQPYTFLTIKAQNIILYARWVPNQYEVTFYTNNNQTETKVIDYAGSIIAVPSYEGHTFIGWYEDELLTILYNADTFPTEDKSLYAKWQINSYNIDFIDYNDVIIQSTLHLYHSSLADLIIPEPQRIGFTFIGWNSSIPEIMPAQSLIIRANYTVNQYTIYFESNGGSHIASITQDYMTSVAKPIDPSRDGYTFDGWFSDSNFTEYYTITTIPANNITLYAKWILNVYTITYELNGGDNDFANPQTYTIITDHFSFLSPTKIGYTFTGWYDNEIFDGSPIISQNQGSFGNITLYAKWEVNQYEVNYYLYDNDDSLSRIMLYPGEIIIDISLEGLNSSALTSFGRLFMWGYNGYGQLGDGTTTYNKSPLDITQHFNLDESEIIIQVSLGSYHSIALTSRGRIFTWGRNDIGALGDGSWIDKNTPQDITSGIILDPNDQIIQISAGFDFSMALTSNGRIFTWGRNDIGTLGDGTVVAKNKPTEISSNFSLQVSDKIIQIIAGGYHASALTNLGRLFMWGWNAGGQLGDGSVTQSNMPLDITPMFDLNSGDTIAQVSLGSNYSFALSKDGKLFTWGHNAYGQLGDGTNINKNTPVDISLKFDLNISDKIIHISTGSIFSTAYTLNGRLFTWGRDDSNLKDGLVTSSNEPIDISSRFDINLDDKFIKISLGDSHSAFLTEKGYVYVCGVNDQGQLGNGTTNSIFEPTKLVIVYPNLELSETYDYHEHVAIYTPTLIGYSFSGWYTLKGTMNQLENMPAYNSDLYGYWVINLYKINYVFDELNEFNPSSYTIKSNTILLEESIKVGYTFRGWYDNELFLGDAITNIPQGSTGDITLYAKWEINSYTITFETNEGSIIEPITQVYQSNVLIPDNPTKQGYTFSGWFTNEILLTQYTFTYMPAQDLKLYAKWDPNIYVTTYVLNNGQNDKVVEGYSGSRLLNPTYEGYDFIGWYTDEELQIPYELGTFPTSSMTLYAKWEAKTYQVWYYAGQDLIDSLQESFSYDSEVALPILDLEDKIFVGWYHDGKQVKSGVWKISFNVMLVARWAEPVSTISLDVNGGTMIDDDSKIVYYDMPYTLPIPELDSVPFIGWYLGDIKYTNELGESLFNYKDIGDITLVAMYYVDISSAEELNNIRFNLSTNYRLINDVDLSGFSWSPIGTIDQPFTGIFDGQGFTIQNLNITVPEDFIGLFGVNQGIIKNVNLGNVNINIIGGIDQIVYAGAITGKNNGVVNNIQTLNGSIYLKVRNGANGYLGGLIGYNNVSSNLNMDSMVNHLDVTGDLTTYTGGILGYGYGSFTIINSINTGSVTGTYNIGGIVGAHNSSLYIISSLNRGTITGLTNVGGLIGYVNDYSATTVYDSYNEGSIFGLDETEFSNSSKSVGVGGLIGYVRWGSYTYINDSFNLGDVTGQGSHIAGLIGHTYVDSPVFINNSYNSGNITSKGRYVAGLIAYLWWRSSVVIVDSYNNGTISGSNDVAGIIGNAPDQLSFNNVRNYGDVNATSNGVGGLIGIGSYDSKSKVIIKSSNSGTIQGNEVVGGLFGAMGGPTSITDSFNTGDVIGKGDYIGGIIGSGTNISIVNVYNSGNIYGEELVGGIVGSAEVLYMYASVNFGNVYSFINTNHIGGIYGNTTAMSLFDIENVYYFGLVIANHIIIAGVQLGQKEDNPYLFTQHFFISILGWNDQVWNFDSINVIKGMYPALLK